MTKTRQRALLAGALAIGAVALIGGSMPAYADVCDQLAAWIAQLQSEEEGVLQRMMSQGSYNIDGRQTAAATASNRQQQALLLMHEGSLRQIRAKRASYERQYAKKNCGEYQAQRDAARSAATGAALGAIGFGIMSGAMGGGYRGGYRGSSGGYGSSGRSGYGSSGGSGYRRY